MPLAWRTLRLWSLRWGMRGWRRQPLQRLLAAIERRRSVSEQIILGIDPGEVVLGYCIGGFKAQQRRIIASGDLRDVTPDKLARWMNALCCQYRPDVVAIEGYDWQGEERSANQNAFKCSRLAGDVEGAAQMWSLVCSDGLMTVVVVSKSEANRTIGVTGKTPKSRVKGAIEALFPGAQLPNEHQRDAAVVCLAGRYRRAA
jgi:Holliday junction resolvasome RuvABC endonuclease subunit